MRPPIGVEVVLECPGATTLDAEVGGYDGEQVLLVPHADAGDAESEETRPPAAGAEGTLSWTTARGVHSAPVVVAGGDADWRVTLVAAATRTQRREYVRLPLHDHMTLSHRGGVERATLADLSEAALRVRLPEARAELLPPGADVQAAFTLHRTGFVLRGTILRAQPAEEEGMVDLIVMLNIPARTANVLRRTVVLAQIARRSSRREMTDPAL